MKIPCTRAPPPCVNSKTLSYAVYSYDFAATTVGVATDMGPATTTRGGRRSTTPGGQERGSLAMHESVQHRRDAQPERISRHDAAKRDARAMGPPPPDATSCR